MTTDFRSMAAKAKQEYEGRVRDEAAKVADEKSVRMKRINAGISCLNSEVLPLLEEAKIAFQSQDIPVEIKIDFDVKNYLNRDPSVSFICAGPKRKNRNGGTSNPQARPATFFSDGEKIIIELGTQIVPNSPKEEKFSAEFGKAESIIAKAIQSVLDSYFVSIDELRRHGHWEM